LGLNVRNLRQRELLQPLGALPESTRNLRSLVLGKRLVLTCYAALYFVDLLVPGLGYCVDSLWISAQNVAHAITCNLTKLFSALLDLEDVLLQKHRDLGLRDGGNIVAVLGFQVLHLGPLHHPAVPDKGHFCDPKSPGDFLHLTQSGDSPELAQGLPYKGKSMRNRGVSSPMPFLLIPRSLLRGGFIQEIPLSLLRGYRIKGRA